MISKGSCDTEDWSNDAKNSALITGINYIWQYIHILNCNDISQYYCFYCIFDQIHLVLISISDFFQPKLFELYCTYKYQIYLILKSFCDSMHIQYIHHDIHKINFNITCFERIGAHVQHHLVQFVTIWLLAKTVANSYEIDWFHPYVLGVRLEAKQKIMF